MRPATTYVEAALREQGEHSVKVPMTVSAVYEHPGRHDHAARRRAKRSGREGGCWTYIPAELLREAGYASGDPLPWYRVWGGRRGRFVVTLYREP